MNAKVWFVRSIAPVLVTLPILAGGSTSAEDPAPAPKSKPSSAPTSYRDFRLGMTRTAAWETIQRLGGVTVGKTEWISIPSYAEDNIEEIRLGFSDGLNAWTSMGRYGAPLYGDAVVYSISVRMRELPRPIGDFPISFLDAFGPTYYNWRPCGIGRYYSSISIDDLLAQGPRVYGTAYDETFTYQWIWPPPDDLGAWLEITIPADKSYHFLKKIFLPRFTIEQGFSTLVEEENRDRAARTAERTRAAQGVVSGILGQPESEATTEDTAPISNFFGSPIQGKRLACLMGRGIASTKPSSKDALAAHPFSVVWREWGNFIGGLPPSARILGDTWRNVDRKEGVDPFVPAVPRHKADLLASLYAARTTSAYFFVSGDPRPPRYRGTKVVGLHELPLHVLDRVSETMPDCIVMVIRADDFPATKDQILAHSLEKTSLPRFEIVEVQPGDASGKIKPRTHPGLEALAKVSGGRYRIWVGTDKPLVTIVEPPGGKAPDPAAATK